MGKILQFFESVIATAIGGVCLAISLILSILKIDVPIFLDPAWVAVVFSGVPLILLAIKRIINNKGISKISSALLISIGMVASIAIGDLFAAGEVAFIMAIGEILEDKTTEKAKKGLKKLMDLSPDTARRIIDGKEEIIDVGNISVGDVIRILPGETVAVDGVIISGETSIDQSVMTGESLPVDKGIEDIVYSGTINRFGAIDIKATAVGEDSSLNKLIKMVKDAEDKKAPMQRIADKWASYLVPVALLLAIISGLIRSNITVAVTMLVVFCPCALVLATPTAIMAAIGQATKHGVIIKSGDALEKMGRVKTIAFDKTGTLTYGELEVSDIANIDKNYTKEELLKIIASAEQKSEHPLAKAVVLAAKKQGSELYSSDDFVMEVGRGITASVDGKKLFCGSERFIADKGIAIEKEAAEIIDSLRNDGKALLIAADDKNIIGIIALSDKLKPRASDMIKRLGSYGVKSVLLTGDNRKTANHFAKLVGINNIKSELLPDEKVSAIEELKQNGNTVAMIGDGVNDAPALKIADVGVAMGTMGSDIAVEAADIAIMSDDISKIPYLKRLSTATVNTIKFSISLSLIINLLAIVLSFFSLLNPTTGALVHNAGSCFVVLIAALLYDRKLDK
ncbi:MAG: cation-translocating P-type ATPase [Clostridia bacterium]|nr:cation-translocating P-type ATPase [Clostridia bacterium]